jgi:membrane protease YdiL (CAAX protease family)
VALAWVVILLTVLVVVTKERWGPALGKRSLAGPTTRAADEVDIRDVRSPQLLLVARYAVGARALTGGSPTVRGGVGASARETQPATTRSTTSPATSQASTSASAIDPTARQFLAQVGEAARTPVDEFRVIPVVGELAGARRAVERLDQFERSHKVVRLRRDVDLLRTLYTHGPEALGAQDRQFLVDRHGWFGQLALAYGAPSDSEMRGEVIDPAKRVVIVLMLISLGALGAAGIGVVLLILAAVWVATGTLRRAYVPPAPWRAGPFGEAFAVYLCGFVVLSVAMGLLLGGLADRSIWPSAAVVVVLPVVVAWLKFRGITWAEVVRGLGWHRGRGVLREVWGGLVGYVAGLPVVGVGMLISMWLMKKTGEQAVHPIVNHPIDRPIEAWGVFVLACVVAPIVEETMFRGALFHHLRGKFGFVISALLTSVIFAAIHPQGWAAVPVLGAIAVVLAGIRQWRGSIIGCVVAHSLNNSAVTLILLVGMS